MSKGKFEPGKRVLLLDSPFATIHSKPFVRTQQTLGHRCSVFPKHWDMTPPLVCSDGIEMSWPQENMILLDPDESPEQSAEAMRDLYSLPKKVTA